jgi:hypothetical protein
MKEGLSHISAGEQIARAQKERAEHFRNLSQTGEGVPEGENIEDYKRWMDLEAKNASGYILTNEESNEMYKLRELFLRSKE